MITPELVDYIKKELAAGKDQEELKTTLLKNGWGEADINGALNLAVSFTPPPVAVVPPVSPPGEVQPPAARISQPAASAMAQGGIVDDLTDEEIEQIYGGPEKPANKKLIFIALGLVLFLLIGGGVLAYFNFFQTPEKILAKAFDKNLNLKSGQYSGSVQSQIKIQTDLFRALNQIGTPSPTPALSAISPTISFDSLLNFDGSFDHNDPAQKNEEININLMGKQGKTVIFGLGLKVVNSVYYVGVTETDVSLGEAAAALKGKWFKVDLQELEQKLKDAGMTFEEFRKISSTPLPSPLIQEKIQELTSFIKSLNAIKIKEKLTGEKIDGQNTYHYSYVIDKEAMKKLMDKIYEIIGQEVEPQYKEELDKSIDEMSEITGEIWIGKKDLMIKKFTENYDLGQNQAVSGKISLTFFMKEFNKPVSIEAPSNPESLADALIDILKGFFPSLTEADCLKLFGEQKDDCYSQVALSSLNKDICLKVATLTKRYDCYTAIVLETGNEAICQDIRGTGSQGWKDECYRALAEKTGNSGLCAKIVITNWKNYCLGVSLKDETYCAKITKADARKTCQDKVGLLNTK